MESEVDVLDTTFGELVQMKRNLLGLSMRELARRTDVDVAYISKMEKGQALNPNFSVVMKIARELNINMETLIRAFELEKDMVNIINTSIQSGVKIEEKEAVQGIVQDVIKLTDNHTFDLNGVGALLQKINTLHQQKHKTKDMFYVITLENKEWVHVLETPVVDTQLFSLYHQAMEINENNSFVVHGEILSYPDNFNEHRVLTLEELLDKCNSIQEDDDMYMDFFDLKEYLNQILANLKHL